MNEEMIKKLIRQELAQIFGIDKYTFTRDMQIANGRNIQIGKSVGTSIGTESTQRLSVYGEIPVVQAGAISAPNSQTGSYVQADAQSIVTAVNSIRTALTNFGITA